MRRSHRPPVPFQVTRAWGAITAALWRHGEKRQGRESSRRLSPWGGQARHALRGRPLRVVAPAHETDANLKRWIDEYVVAFDRRIGRARIEVERQH